MTDHPAFCPRCGFNIERDRPVTRGGWRLTPEGVVYFAGKRVKLAAVEGQMLHSMAALNRPLERSVLAARIGSNAEDVDQVVQVRISQIRRSLLDAGIPLPFETVNKRGYLWVAE